MNRVTDQNCQTNPRAIPARGSSSWAFGLRPSGF